MINSTPDITKTVVKTQNLIASPVDNELLIYNRTTHKAYCLNSSISVIWNALDNNSSMDSIVNALRLSGRNEKADKDVVVFAIDQLRRSGLLKKKAEHNKKHDTIKRRDLVQKFGAAMLLPSLSAVSVPTAFAQASCVPFMESCGSDAECCSGRCNPQGNCVGGGNGGRG